MAHRAPAAATAHRAWPRGATPHPEVKGRGREDPMPQGRQPRGVIPCPRSGAVAESARLRQRRNGREDLPHVQGQGRRPGGATPRPRSGLAAKRSYPAFEVRGGGWEDKPHVQGAVGAWAQEGLRSFSTFKVRRGGGEEIPLVWGKEQWLHFAGAAVKRYLTPKVRQNQVRR